MNPIETNKKGEGRKKIEIKRIEKEAYRQVCFFKRRQGLFKKADELYTLCGDEVIIIVFSIICKPYSFGRPSADHVLPRFCNVPSSSEALPTTTNCVGPMNPELACLCENLEEEMSKGRALKVAQKVLSPVSNTNWRDNNLNVMGIEELREFKKVLLELQALIAQAEQQGHDRAQKAAMRQIDGLSTAEVGEDDYLLLQ